MVRLRTRPPTRRAAAEEAIPGSPRASAATARISAGADCRSQNNKIRWDEDYTSAFAEICSKEVIESHIVGKPSKNDFERICLRLREQEKYCTVSEANNKWDAMKRVYNFYNKVKDVPIKLRTESDWKKEFEKYDGKKEYLSIQQGHIPRNIDLFEIMFGKKVELREKPNLMPAISVEVMKVAEVTEESLNKLLQKLEAQTERLKDLRMSHESLKSEVVAFQTEFREKMSKIGSSLRPLVYLAKKYYEVVTENERLSNEIQKLEGGAKLLIMKRPAGSSVAGKTSFQAGRSVGRSIADGWEATAKRMQKTTPSIVMLPPMKSANCKMKPPKTPGGGWETIGKKKKSGQAAGRGQWAPWSSPSNAPPTTARQPWNGNGPSRPSGNNVAQPSDRRPLQAPNPVVTPPLAKGWQWASRSRPSGPESNKDDGSSSGFDPETNNPEVEDLSDDDDDDDEDMSDDDYDSDASEKSFETRKTSKWFKSFFDTIDALSLDQIHEHTRQWHCPACKNGPGAIDWFKGIPSLVTHARTKGSKRVKVHRELAALLEEEMSRRGSSVVPSGEQFGKWKGLRESTDREIVWPPMVIVMNTLLEKDEDDKWLGMGNQELLEYFSDYAATKARHAYGPGGHRGMSVLIFESCAVGYMEAERLHKHFVDQRTDRDTWQTRRVPFLPGGKRQLYGFLARKDDMEMFNRHCQGKSRLKYEMRSHNEMVVAQMKQMSEDNQQLNYLKNKVVKTEQRSKVVEETLGVVTQKLRETMEENIFVRRKAKEKHSEYEEEMKSQEKFFHDQIENIHKATEDKESEFERLLQEERAKARQWDVDSGTNENRRLRKEQVQRFIDCQVKDVQEFESERDVLINAHEEKKAQLKKEYMAKELELEKEFDAALTGLMKKHKPDTFQASSS